MLSKLTKHKHKFYILSLCLRFLLLLTWDRKARWNRTYKAPNWFTFLSFNCWIVLRKHKGIMMTSSDGNIFASLAFVQGIRRSPVNCPHKGQWRGALVFSAICAWTNGAVNNRDAGDLRRHRAQYDVTVMIFTSYFYSRHWDYADWWNIYFYIRRTALHNYGKAFYLTQ